MGKRFNKLFNTRLKKLKVEIELNKNYVDDFLEVVSEIDPGVRLDVERMQLIKVVELVEEDENVPADSRSINLLKQIANTIFPSMQFTVDCPSMHQNKKMPVLDIQMSLSNNNKIVYEFFEKPCANKFTITKASAHNNRMKMSVLVEEGVRRMRNCSRNLEPEVVNGVMGKWAEKLRRSGYPQTTRHQVIKTAVQKFESMCKVEDGGGRPVHRPRTWQRRERLLDKELKAGGSWCKGETDQITAPLIMDPTAGKLGDSVRKACNDYEAATGIGVRLKLRAGAKMGADAKSEPLRSKECGRPNCFCCGSGNPGGCEKNGSAYTITCNGCGSNQIVAQYEGETGRNCFSRGLEHQNDLRTMKEDSPLWKHCVV